jgi:signal transduction histidine kinase
MTLYVWIGLLMTVAIAALAVAAGRGIARSLRVAGMKADLVATVSHELKTPVSSMRLLVDTLLADAAFDPRKTREYLELIARANVRLGQLIENFLAFSRMERNKYAFEFTAVRAEDLVRAAVEAAGDRFRDDGCELRVKVAPGLPEIRADEGALVTALVNLLDNAYKYTPGEKRIELGAFAENGHVCFEVRDQGIGIEPRDLRKIFRKFYQADSRLARTGGCCGLGLSIVRFLVEAHGGSVRVSSTPGKGSVFTVTLRAAS